MLTSSNFKNHKNKQALVIFSLASLFLFGLTLQADAKLISVGTSTDSVYMGGSLGIGITNPTKKLEIIDGTDSIKMGKWSTGGYASIWFDQATPSDTNYGFLGNATETEFNAASLLYFNISDNEKMRINSSGNVGIGTTNPGTILEVQSSNDNILRLRETGGGWNYIEFYNDTIRQGYFGMASNGTDFQFSPIGNTTIPSGNLGVGLTNPGTKLDVTGTFRNSLSTTHTLLGGSGNVVMMVDNTGTLYTTTTASLLSGGANFWGGTKNGNIWNGDAGVGNVGIGTASPQAGFKLDINGQSVTRGDMYVNGSLIEFGSSGFQLSKSGNSWLNGGNVGIGTTNPTQKLYVTGSIGADSQLVDYNVNAPQIVLNHSSSGWGLIQNDAAGKWSLGYNGVSTFNTLGTPVLTWTNGGNVGIGTTTPGYKLDVQGSARFAAQSLTYGSIEVGGYYASTPAYWTAKIVGDYYGNQYNANVAHGLSFIGGRAGFDNFRWFKSDYTELMTLKDGGNLGIGTTNPGTKLDVSGTLRNSLSTTHTLLGGTGNVVVMADNTGALYTTTTAALLSGGTSIWGGTKNGTIWNGDAGVGNVGIGTTAPGGPLEVSVNTDAHQEGIARFFNKGAATGGRATSIFIGKSAVDGGTANIGYVSDTATPANSRIYLSHYTHGESVSILNNGNVGIGVNNPARLLDVNGTFRVSGGSVYSGATMSFYTDGSGAQTLRTGGVLVGTTYDSTPANNEIRTSSNQNLTLNARGTGILNFSTADNVKMSIINNGNVGIGITAPDTPFEVYHVPAANNTFDDVLKVTSKYPTAATTGFGPAIVFSGSISDPQERVLGRIATVQDSTNVAGMAFSTQNTADIVSEKMRISSQGNIGIGNTAPGTKLDITGTLRNSLATTHSLLGGSGNVVVMADNTGALYTSTAASSLLWSGTTGGNIWNANSGNVGIGTTDPQSYKLYVNGGDQYNSASINSYSLGARRSGGTGYAVPDLYGVTGGLVIGGLVSGGGTIALNTTGGATPTMYLNTSGNVGVGTTAPGMLFQVRNDSLGTWGGRMGLANATADKEVFFGTYGSIGGVFAHNNALNAWAPLYVNTTSGSTDGGDVIIAGSAKVGIGTNAPNASLDVYNGSIANRTANINHYRNVLMSYFGNGAQTGTLKIVLPQQADTMIDITIKGYDYTGVGAWEARVSGYVYSGTGGGWYTSNHKAQIIGSAPFSQIRLAYDGSKPVILLGNTSTVWSYGSFEITDVTTTYNNLTGWGAGWSSSLVTSETGLTTIATPAIYAYTNSAGNLGINTTNPGARLDVSGTFRNSLATTHSLLSGSGNVVVMADNNGTLYTSTAASSLLWSGSTGGNIWSANSGNVGIGTTAPASKLDVSGNIALNGKTAIYGYDSWLRINESGTFSAGNYFGSGIVRTDGELQVGGSGSTLRVINGGNVGIGKTNPSATLDITGTLNSSISINSASLCINGACKTDWSSFVPMAGNVTLTGPLTIPGLSLSSTLDLTTHNITNVGKLTVGTIDPLYNIHNVNYSTFAPSIAGGVKEEYIGKAKINSKNTDGEYEFVVDFDNQKEGSDLWVWRHTVDFSDDNVQVLITPSGKKADIYYVIADNKLILKSDTPVSASYHLIGNRIDWQKWPTRAVDQTEKASFIIK